MGVWKIGRLDVLVLGIKLFFVGMEEVFVLLVFRIEEGSRGVCVCLYRGRVFCFMSIVKRIFG